MPRTNRAIKRSSESLGGGRGRRICQKKKKRRRNRVKAAGEDVGGRRRRRRRRGVQVQEGKDEAAEGEIFQKKGNEDQKTR